MREADSWSRNQIVASSPWTPAAGISWTSAVAVAERAAHGLGLVGAADHEPHLVGPVEGREGQADPLRRRLGGVGDRDGDRVVDVELREAGEQRGDVAVGPDAEHHQLEASGAGGADRVGVRRRRARRRRPPRRSTGSRGPGPGRPRPVEEVRAGLAGVAVVGVGGDEALVAPEEVDPRPVDVAVGGQPRDLAVDRVRRWCRRSAPPGGRRRRLHTVTSRRKAPATEVARSAATRAPRPGGRRRVLMRSHPVQLQQRARGRGVHLVLVEAAQLLGEQLGQLRAA